jgi:uncharacterized protein (DUF58 family)
MLSESLLQSLRLLRLNAPRRRAGLYAGERRSPRRGRSVEFADYRNYTPGDDPRRVDWNIYARLERPYIRLFEDEEDLTVYLLLDDSPSMFWQAEEGDGLAQKWLCAAQLAAALGYVALASGDRVVVETSRGQRFGPRRGVASAALLIAFIERISVESRHRARAALNAWLKRCARDVRPGLAILISDMLDEDGATEGIGALAGKGLAVNLLHTLCPDELTPALSGDLQLVDVETNGAQEVSLDAGVLAAYHRQLSAWRAQVAAEVQRFGGRYVLVNTSQPLEAILLRDLRREGWLS